MLNLCKMVKINLLYYLHIHDHTGKKGNISISLMIIFRIGLAGSSLIAVNNIVIAACIFLVRIARYSIFPVSGIFLNILSALAGSYH